MQDAHQQGRQHFTTADWAAERRSWDLLFANVEQIAVTVVPPRPGEPLLSTLFVRLTVENSQEYLKSLTQSFELANELTQKSQSEIKLIYEVTPTQIGKTEGLAIVSDFDEATGDQNLDIWQSLLTSSLGTDHELAIYCAPLNPNQVFIGLQSSERLGLFMDDFQAGEKGLAQNLGAQGTMKLLDQDAPFVLLLNPQGFVDIARSWMKAFMVLGIAPEIPLFPSAPPIGLSISSADRGWQGELIFPRETQMTLSQFAADVKEAFGQ